jgi:hypothetical protein
VLDNHRVRGNALSSELIVAEVAELIRAAPVVLLAVTYNNQENCFVALHEQTRLVSIVFLVV